MRLFVAVNLPAAEKTRLGAVLDELRRSLLPLRWVEPDALHITIKFFGEVTEQSRSNITIALSKAAEGSRPFDIRIGGFGTFPERRRARVMWLGVEQSAPLEQLQNRLEAILEPIGFAREPRAFHAHITLGRASSNARGVEVGEVDRITRNILYDAVVPVNSMDLMRSHLSARGAQYEKIEQVMLGGGTI